MSVSASLKLLQPHAQLLQGGLWRVQNKLQYNCHTGCEVGVLCVDQLEGLPAALKQHPMCVCTSGNINSINSMTGWSSGAVDCSCM